MKTRNGFVSNSSSSSFIIALDKLPENAQEMHELLFNSSKEEMLQLYDFYDAISSFEIAEIVFRDITSKNESVFNIQQLVYELLCGCVDGIENFYDSKFARMNNEAENKLHEEARILGKRVYDDPDFSRMIDETYSTFYDIHNNIAMEDAKNVATMFLNSNKGKLVFSLSYSDNAGGIECQIEHGNTFRNIPHIQISHH